MTDRPRPDAGRIQLRPPVRFDRSAHQTAQFDCGAPELDRWLQHSASQSERKEAARTYVTVDAGGAVRGFVTLVAGRVRHGEASAAVAKRMSPHFPIPVALIARLAVDGAVQSRGVGIQLLRFALERCLEAGEQIGIRAVVVEAIDERAAAFYERFGFSAVPGAPPRLMVTMAEVRAGTPGAG